MRRPYVPLLFACAVLAPCASPLEAQENVISRLNGTYTNLASDAGRTAIERGVEHGIDGLFALGKPTARSRLRQANPPIPTLEIDVAGGSIRVNLGHGRNTTSAPGAWQPARSAAGDAIRIRYTNMPDSVLKMESLSEGGSARHTFHVSEEGSSLRHDVRLESSRLPHHVSYTLRYRRVP